MQIVKPVGPTFIPSITAVDVALKLVAPKMKLAKTELDETCLL